MTDKFNSFFKKFKEPDVDVNEILRQNQALNLKINSQEDDFNLQYKTFQSELQNLGQKIAALEEEKKKITDENISLKKSLAGRKISVSSGNTPSDTELERSEKDDEFSNEYELEIERLKKENLEKSRTVSKLFNEKLKAEAEFCSKYERLKSQIKGKSEAEDKIKSLENDVRELKQDIRDGQGLVESLKESIVSKDEEKAYLEKICEQRKKALDDLAVTSQKEI